MRLNYLAMLSVVSIVSLMHNQSQLFASVLIESKDNRSFQGVAWI
jgi:hypothetical protein